jgi:hypothetical protein
MKTLGILCAFALLSGCGVTDDRVAGGTTSEVPNALTGNVVDPSGRPVAGVAIRIASSATWADSVATVDTTRTDSLGRWSLRTLRNAGDVTLYLHTADAGALARLSVGPHDSLVRRDTLRGFAWIRGSVLGATGTARVAVRGTDLVGRADAQGQFLFAAPPGALNLLVVADSQGVGVRRTLEITTTPGDTTRAGTLSIAPLPPQAWASEDYSLWDSSRSATIDLTSAGAGISGDHVGFPIPVRLDSVLDIRTAKPGEIRFDNGKGTRYPFEIETWDTLSGKALAWVRLDTANGRSNKHSLRVFWGRPGAAMPTGMPAVFDASNGFLAAWHLGEATETSRANRLAWQSTTTGEGVFGPMRATTERSSYQTDPVALGGADSWTVSLWVKLDRKPSGEILLAGFRDGPDAANWGLSIRDDLVVRVWSGADMTRSLESPSALPLGKWVRLAATFEAVSSRIGLVVDSTSVNRRTVVFPTASTQRLQNDSGFLQGGVDEIRLSNLDRTTEWSALEAQVGAPGVAWLRWN